MVTKSKSFKHTSVVKCICILLAIFSIVSACLCAVYLPLYANFNDLNNWNVPKKVPYTDTDSFENYVRSDITAIDDLMHLNLRNKELQRITALKEKAVEEETQRFLWAKASIIANEVYYVATHYDRETDDYYEQAFRKQFETTTSVEVSAATTAAQGLTPETTKPPKKMEQTTAEPHSLPHRAITVDDHAPYNVRYCQMLVNTVDDLDWLQYESLVRSEAFEEREFEVSFEEYTGFHFGTDSYTYLIQETQLRADLENQYDSLVTHMQNNLDNNREDLENRLSDRVNLLYYATSEDGKTYTNLGASNKADETIRACPMWMTIKADGVREIGENSQPLKKALQGDSYAPTLTGDEAISVGIAQIPFAPGDIYYTSQHLYDSVVSRFSLHAVLILGSVSLLILLATTILLLVFCGHTQGSDGIHLYLVDRIPTDIHLIVSAGCCLGAAAGCIILADQLGLSIHSYTDSLNPLFICGMILLVILFWLIGMEWLTSTLRIKRAGQSYFRNFILWKSLIYVFRGIRWCMRWIRKGFHFLLDKPKKIRKIFLVAHLVFALIVVLLILIGAFNENLVIPVFGIPIVTLLFLLAQVYFLRMLDRIIEASCDRSKLPIKGIEQMPNALQTLANNLTITNRDLDRAVAEAVKNERTKAELITNVSHDLKTPLTSVISYVDLLKKCDITDPKALEYLDTLTEKGEKLKHLVEDLIEASKVSTGNVTLQPVALNLSELAMQAVVEYTPALEAQSLEIIFSQPDLSPIIHADSTKTYRILENLLSNVCKYAAPRSRVYANVGEKDGYGLFEIKNISKDPLNVDPQELMERFVRGDASRSEEGNGLGLSIAQQLCTLQGGRLELQIDGDLFKATVYLPRQNMMEEKTESE